MGEIAALSRAFDTEFNKHYEALPRLAHDPDHDTFLNHYRQVQRIAESIAYYASRLPPYASVHRILAFGDRLAQREEHRLALEACYSYVKHLNIHQRNVVRADELTCLSWHVQACYGVAVCEATLVLHQDPQMKHPDTLAAVVACLHQLKDVLVLVLPSEQLYWLTLNGTLHIYSLAKRLLTAGYVAQMLPFMVFCVKALESHVIFSTSKYLTWRTQLYISLCYAYCDVREHGMAKQVVQEGLSKIDALIKLQKLDPVPAPPEVQAAYRTAKAMLCALKLKLEVICAPSGSGESRFAHPKCPREWCSCQTDVL
ncbi:hypothetical protein DUNSADRAFT_7735 [Dunaliella salina]|uniref:Uncharacterized protein n=1 Tax=Dunaliella salina TaxID=3046 RepID=A0ABQ7FTL3_DUNSA|nr:hypothetical protein DUNSADRAFT_7735 [Dunaliella salina]|eukprot:KAF5825670.1 hypothetical protein DUNSADRAFT_7735 [Dunaliella salina]